MRLTSETLDNGIVHVALEGRLDIAGAHDIETQFVAITATRKAAVMVDLSQVEFIASIGIRVLLSSARAQAGRGGKLVLVSPVPAVREVLVTAGITDLIPVLDDGNAAEQALQAAAAG